METLTQSIESALGISLEDFKQGKMFELNVNYGMNVNETIWSAELTNFYDPFWDFISYDDYFNSVPKFVKSKAEVKVKARLWHSDSPNWLDVTKSTMREAGLRPANTFELITLGKLKIDLKESFNVRAIGARLHIHVGMFIYCYIPSIVFPKGCKFYLEQSKYKDYGNYLAIVND